MNSHIKTALLNGRLVLLLGAGASRGCRNQLNQDIPLGWDLAKILASEMGEELADEDLSEVYSAARAKLGSQVDSILEKHFKHCSPSVEYNELVKFPFFRVYSLNIDDALEKAAQNQSKRFFNVKQRNDNITEVDQFYKTLDLIKLNGDVARTKDGFIFSPQEYGDGAAQEPLWYTELGRDYHKYTFVFIGTKLKEPLFFHQIQKYKARTGVSDLKSYLLIPSLTSIQQTSLEASNIHHVPGTLSDFVQWLKAEFPEIPTSEDIVRHTRPELIDEAKKDNKKLDLFSGVTPVSRSSLALISRLPSHSKIRDFYKGFKPTWFDIMEGVPAYLENTKNFYDQYLANKKASPLDLFLLYGSAGCGKTTTLKQIALRIADEGDRNVYFIDEYKDNLSELVRELDYRNSKPYYLFIDRISDLAPIVATIIKGALSTKAIFVSAENPKIWNSRGQDHLGNYKRYEADVSEIQDCDAENILDKLEIYGNWTRLAQISKKDRKKELLQKSKKQLLIGLIEVTSGEGYNKIIQKDYKSISCESEKALLILAGLATTQRVPASEATLTRALSYLGLNSDVHYLASQMDGIVRFSNGSVTTRHRVYIERLFKLYVPKAELFKVYHAYIKSFSVYHFPIVKNISRNESTVYKHLVNAKALRKVFQDDREKVLSIYESFEKAFENEGLFLMQYGLALRSFGQNESAYEKLRIANQAFQESPQIEHALAQQRIILACQEKDETIALAYLGEAEQVLNRLNSNNIRSHVETSDRYPIITLSEGHVKVLDNLGHIMQAKVVAKQYHTRISDNKDLVNTQRIKQTLANLMKYYLSGKWPDKNGTEY
jgi:hypothetical protein